MSSPFIGVFWIMSLSYSISTRNHQRRPLIKLFIYFTHYLITYWVKTLCKASKILSEDFLFISIHCCPFGLVSSFQLSGVHWDSLDLTRCQYCCPTYNILKNICLDSAWHFLLKIFRTRKSFNSTGGNECNFGCKTLDIIQFEESCITHKNPLSSL